MMIDLLEDYLMLSRVRYEVITGDVTGNARQMSMDRFQNNANNIHCWNCFTNFCAHCKKKLAKGKVGKHAF